MARSGREVLSASKTRKDPGARGIYWRYLNADSPAFDPVVFSETQLIERGFISGEASAGRGNTYFFTLNEHSLVLRHYRRGGLASKVSSHRYIFTGLSKTRAMREFDVCLKMYNMKLPVPKPYACRVVHTGVTYQASIVTHRLQGSTLAELLCSNHVNDESWASIGRTIGRFHKAGIYHADLNAHNIMLDHKGVVSVIDFDRAQFRYVGSAHYKQKWCVSNIERLQRSIVKELNKVNIIDAQTTAIQSQSLVHAPIKLIKSLNSRLDILVSAWRNHT